MERWPSRKRYTVSSADMLAFAAADPLSAADDGAPIRRNIPTKRVITFRSRPHSVAGDSQLVKMKELSDCNQNDVRKLQAPLLAASD